MDLAPTIAELSAMCANGRWATDDALGIGGLLEDATRLAELVFQQKFAQGELLYRVLTSSARSLQALDEFSLRRPASHRLAFRELGLAIGLSGAEQISELLQSDRQFTRAIDSILKFRSFGEEIRDFWSGQHHRSNPAWADHRDINSVMLATSLLPEGFLGL
jgi:hypothetical protein